jgi:hypothetical protein
MKNRHMRKSQSSLRQLVMRIEFATRWSGAEMEYFAPGILKGGTVATRGRVLDCSVPKKHAC